MRFDKLSDWLAWQEGLNPRSIDLGLERVAPIARRLGVPHPATRSVVIAGTNGKGSCAAFLGEIYRRAGYRTGVYTSPHLLHYNERIVCDGRSVSDAEICQAFARIDESRGDIRLTFFEFGTLAALSVFAARQVEVQILEVGLGGRLDAVNVVDCDCALLTPISLDHEAWLGNDVEGIAAEKAAVMRHARPAIIADPEPPASLLAHGRLVGARMHLAGRDFHVAGGPAEWRWWDARRRLDGLAAANLPGVHQRDNAAAAIAVVSALEALLPVPLPAVRTGIAEARLPGRCTRLAGAVETLLDVAHNPAGARTLAAYVAALAGGARTRVVLGMMRDKRHREAVANLAGVVQGWYLSDLPGTRAAPALDLAQVVRVLSDMPVRCFSTVGDAYRSALADSSPGDRVLVCGSFVTVAEALRQVPQLAAAPELARWMTS